MPNHVINEIIFRDVDQAAQDAIIGKICNAEGKVDFDVLVPTPLNMWLGNVGQRHTDAFGETALEWSRENWGTKWNAYGHKPIERTDGSITFRFESAWSPPYRWLVAVFNGLKRSFDHNWISEGDTDAAMCGKWDYAALTSRDMTADPWEETRGDDTMQKHLYELLYGSEAAP